MRTLRCAVVGLALAVAALPACSPGGGSGSGGAGPGSTQGGSSTAGSSSGGQATSPTAPSTPTPPTTPSTPTTGGGGPNGPGFRTCTATPFSPPPREPFRHLLMSWLAQAFHPEHSAQDVILLPGMTEAVPGKFAYGALSKDLEDEDVRLFLDDCSTWLPLGRPRTNSDGRTSVALDSAALGLTTGVYGLRHAVVGDASVVASQVHVLPPNTQIVVFDIDGTLTTSDTELFIDIFDEYFVPLQNGYTPKAYAGAAALTQAYAAKGYILLYMTGRPYWLTRITREWLDQLGFAPGSLHLADSNAEAWPSEGGVGDYKRDYLRHLASLGYAIEYAYGNATTDIYAYREAGIGLSRTFTIGRHAGEGGTQPIQGDYVNHLSVVAAQPDATQPF